jgi:hypothetical protein
LRKNELATAKILELYTAMTEFPDRANVGRSTFICTFRTKMNCLRAACSVGHLVRSAQAAFKAPPGKSYEKIIGFSLTMFEHAYEYREVQRAMLGSNAEPIVLRQIHGALAAVIGQDVKSEFQKRKHDDCTVSPELLTHFLVSTFISVMSWWLNARNPVPPKNIDPIYRRLVLPCLASVFG